MGTCVTLEGIFATLKPEPPQEIGPQYSYVDHKPLTMADRLLAYRRIVVLTEGASTAGHAKTAVGLLRYRCDHIAAVLDSSQSSKTCHEVFGEGGDTRIISSLCQVSDADALFIGIAPPGGKLPDAWRSIIEEALRKKMDVVSGLHDFISEEPRLQNLAQHSGALIVDIRKNKCRSVAAHASFGANNLRIHTVGQDCGVGKMVVALEIERGLRNIGHDAQFIATGQTGIMIAGKGVPVDAVAADFISGAAENLILEHQQHDTLLIEGQGSLAHPSFSGLTLGLLHGCAPQGLIMCYASGRSSVKELSHVPLRPLADLMDLYETMASVRCPAEVIGIAINGRNLSAIQAANERDKVIAEFGLPACDVYRDGADDLVQAVLDFREEILDRNY